MFRNLFAKTTSFLGIHWKFIGILIAITLCVVLVANAATRSVAAFRGYQSDQKKQLDENWKKAYSAGKDNANNRWMSSQLKAEREAASTLLKNIQAQVDAEHALLRKIANRKAEVIKVDRKETIYVKELGDVVAYDARGVQLILERLRALGFCYSVNGSPVVCPLKETASGANSERSLMDRNAAGREPDQSTKSSVTEPTAPRGK